MFLSRLVMAATMTANYGIYGPAYEMMEHVAVKHGSEEYLDSENTNCASAASRIWTGRTACAIYYLGEPHPPASSGVAIRSGSLHIHPVDNDKSSATARPLRVAPTSFWWS
jgi:starch synthase (maltosyl-transferring)